MSASPALASAASPRPCRGAAGRAGAASPTGSTRRPVVAVGLRGRLGQPHAPRPRHRPRSAGRREAAARRPPDHRLRQPDRQRQAPGRAARTPGRSRRPGGAPAARRRLPDARAQGRAPPLSGHQHPGRRRSAGRCARPGRIHRRQARAAAAELQLRRARPGRFQLPAVLRDRPQARRAPGRTRRDPRCCRAATPTSTSRPSPRRGWRRRWPAPRKRSSRSAPLATVTPLRPLPSASAVPPRDAPFAAELLLNQRITGSRQRARTCATSSCRWKAPACTTSPATRSACGRSNPPRLVDAVLATLAARWRCRRSRHGGQTLPLRQWLQRQARTDPPGASVRRQPRRAGAQRRTQRPAGTRASSRTARRLAGRTQVIDLLRAVSAPTGAPRNWSPPCVR